MNRKSKNLEVAQCRVWMPQLVFSRHLNPRKVGSNASDGMDLLARQEQAGKEQNLSSKSLYRLPAEGTAQIKDVSSHLKIQMIGVWLLTSEAQNRSGFTHFKSSKLSLTSSVTPVSRCSQVDKQEEPPYCLGEKSRVLQQTIIKGFG